MRGQGPDKMFRISLNKDLKFMYSENSLGCVAQIVAATNAAAYYTFNTTILVFFPHGGDKKIK